MKLRNKKTGKIKDFEFVVISKDMDAEFAKYAHHAPVLICRSIDQLNEEWEDYKPKEPLIKDENICKIVRAWAEVNSVEEVLYAERPDRSLCCLTDMGVGDYAIEFVGWVPTLKDGATYTIDELCGEEEE